MSLDITVTDLFCGAGGSSLGAEAAGARLRMAANHWPLAIETHNSNFPDADHDCADISQVNPRRYPSTDILVASPECTNHSQAKANKKYATLWDAEDPSAERSRATMWDVPRFAEAHRYQIVVVENVVEATRWEPYGAWLSAMHSLGYEHKQVFLNSMVAHPTPQSRDRLYVVFWRKGNTPPNLDIRPIAFCTKCECDVNAIQSWKRPERAIGKYRSQYVYRCPKCASIALPYAWPAAAAIDWQLPAQKIGDRDRPLAEATMKRIQAGLDKYGPAAIVQAAGHTFERPGYYRTWPMWQPLNTQATTIQHGLVVDTAYATAGDPANRVSPTWGPIVTQTTAYTQGIVVDTAFLDRDGNTAPAEWPLSTQTGRQTQALLVPLRNHGEAAPTAEPAPTVAAAGNHHALLVRHYTPRGDASEMSKPVSAPAGTVTSHDHHSLVTIPMPLPFLADYHGNGGARPVDEPAGTMDTRSRHAMIEPAPDINECGFRMLEPHEIGRAMAFPDSYKVIGTKRDKVRQYGNAVTPPVMSIILERAIGSLA